MYKFCRIREACKVITDVVSNDNKLKNFCIKFLTEVVIG